MASLRRALIHLRLRFSIVLSPLFLWGVYLADPAVMPWLHLLAAYLIIHIPLYGGMNAFNSYYDRDEGPIGALLEPPPVDRTVLVLALLCKALALLAGFAIDIRFGLLVGAGIILSVLYSHPHFHWKGRPILAAVCIFVMQGVIAVLWGWTAATWTPEPVGMPGRMWPPGLLGALGVFSAALWTLGFYPLTGVYQIAQDRRMNVRTLAVALDVNGSFGFAAVVALLGGLGIFLVLAARGAYPALILSAGYVLAATVFTWRWYRRFATLSDRENQHILMRLSYSNGWVFALLFLGLVLWQAR